MKILYYNWVDYLDPEGRGGGVSVYQRNLLAGMDAEGVDCTFLSSGLSFDLRRGAPRWERVRHGPAQDRARRYEIINSGTLSPGQHAWGDPAQTDHAETVECVSDFVSKTGPYDVIHFNNLEGIPAAVLTLKARFPQTRFVFSLHNYFPLCPQVNLWWQERENCTDFQGGARCLTCLPKPPSRQMLRLANAIAYRLKCAGVRPGSVLFDRAFRPSLGLARRAIGLVRGLRPAPPPPQQHDLAAAAQGFADRRARMVALINAHCDAVLCVSDRVRQIAERHGIRPELTRTSYIGSAQAPLYDSHPARPAFPRPEAPLTLAFLGYMRQDKGFFFLMDALEALPAPLAARIRLVLAARGATPEIQERIEALRPRLAGLDYHDGYTHDGMDALLAPVDVGLVPVLWEDNLPQVAIEMHARRIPLLTSDLGGAQELGRQGAMVFPAGDIPAFHARLEDLIAGRFDAESYWSGAMAPVTVAAHTQAMLALYKGESALRSA